MAGGGASGIAVGTVAVGGVLVWSGLKGASVLTTAQELVQGKKPSGRNTYPIAIPAGTAGGAAGADVTGAAGSVVALALSQVGYHEGAGNSTKYHKDLGWPPDAWCATFICWLAWKTGQKGKVPWTASAPGMAQGFGSRFHLGTSGIAPGDIVFQHGASNGWQGIGHVGICVSGTQMVAGNYGDQVAEYPWNTSKTVGYAKVGWNG